jgi:hypothetical protein
VSDTYEPYKTKKGKKETLGYRNLTFLRQHRLRKKSLAQATGNAN